MPVDLDAPREHGADAAAHDERRAEEAIGLKVLPPGRGPTPRYRDDDRDAHAEHAGEVALARGLLLREAARGCE